MRKDVCGWFQYTATHDSNTLQHTGRKEVSRWFIVMKLDDPNTLNTLICMIHPDANTLGTSMISLFASSQWFIFCLNDHQLDACTLEFTRYPMLHRVLGGLRGQRAVCCRLHVVCLVCWDGEGDKGRCLAAPAVYVFVHTYVQGAQMSMHTCKVHRWVCIHSTCTVRARRIFLTCAHSVHTHYMCTRWIVVMPWHSAHTYHICMCTSDHSNKFALSAHIL